jgi:hypothetical protein
MSANRRQRGDALLTWFDPPGGPRDRPRAPAGYCRAAPMVTSAIGFTTSSLFRRRRSIATGWSRAATTPAGLGRKFRSRRSSLTEPYGLCVAADPVRLDLRASQWAYREKIGGVSSLSAVLVIVTGLRALSLAPLQPVKWASAILALSDWLWGSLRIGIGTARGQYEWAKPPAPLPASA